MARIPVEKRDAGFPWWGWILALLIAVGAIWLIAELLDNDAEIEPVETAAVYEADRNVEDITAFNVIAEPANAGALAGRQVTLQNMKVTSVVGDLAFYAEPADASNDEDVLIVLNEDATPGAAVEGRYDVTEGQQIAIRGSIAEMSPAMAQRLDTVQPQEAQRAQDDRLYILARSLDIQS